MDPFTLMLMGGGLNALGSIFGANSQSNTNQANLNAQLQQQAMMRQMIGGQMQQGQNPYAASILGMLGQMRPPGGQQTGIAPVNGGMINNMYSQGGPPPAGGLYGQGQNTPQSTTPGMAAFDGLNSNMMAAGEGQNVDSGGSTAGAAGTPQIPFMPGHAPTGPQGGLPYMPGGNPAAGGGFGNQFFPGLPGMGFPGSQPPAAVPQSQMYQYNPVDPFTYNPTQLGNAPMAGFQSVGQQQIGQVGLGGAPQIGQAPQLNAPTGLQAAQASGINVANPNMISLESLFSAPQMGQAPQVGAAQVGAPQSVNAQSVAAPAQFNFGDVGAGTVTGTQGQNAGQDALLQMMRRDVGTSQPNQFNTDQLQQLGRGDSQFDNSALFASFAPQDQRMLDEQVAQLKGSKGSFSKLMSSNTSHEEALMRNQFAQGVQARNMGIAQQSFEAAQGRRQPALGQLANLEQFYGQQPFQNAGMQLQAAQAAGQLGQAGQGLDLQAQLANQSTQLASSQANAGNQLQAGLSQNQLASQVALANAANQLQAGQFNAQTGLQAGTQNAQMQQQAGQFNAGNALQQMLAQAQLGVQVGQQNQQLGFQAQQANQNAALQAALANAQYGTQTNLANMGAFNQNNQFGQSLAAQLGQGNQQAALQAMLANQSLQGQYGLQGAQMGIQQNQFGANLNQQALLANQQAGLQAGLANQNTLAQYGMANANIMNQAGQFNANAGQQAASMNAQQGNTYNQLIMSMLGQANAAQQGQQNSNNQLLGILGGVGIPQAQPSPWPGALSDAGSTAMMMPLLAGMMNNNQPSTGFNWTQYHPSYGF